MEASFPLPNEVCGSNNKGSRTSLADTRKYNNVTTMKTSIARPSRTKSPEPAWNDDVIAGTKKIAELATTLKILKLACVCLAITTVINSATFGGLIQSLMTRVDSNERIYDTLQSEMSKRLSKTPTVPANYSAFPNEIESRLLTLESDLGTRMDEIESTVGTNTVDIVDHSKRLMRYETSGLELEPNNTNNQLLDISHRIGILEAYQTQDRAEFFDVRTKLDSIETNIGAYIANIEENSMKLAKVETELAINKTNDEIDLQDIRHRVGILESYQNHDRAEFQEMDSRLGTLELEYDTYTQSIKNNSKMLAELGIDVWKTKPEQELHETELQEMSIAIYENTNNLTKFEINLEEAKSGLQNLSSIIEGLDLDANTDFVSMQNFTTELRNIYDDIQREKYINEEHDIALSQLEVNRNFLINITQNHTSRIAQLELYRDTDYSTIKLNEVRIAELADNLTSENSVIKSHNDDILAVRNSLLDLEADIRAQNASLLVHVDRLAQLELDRADDRNVLQSQDSRLSFVETNIMSLNVTLQNHSSRIEELDSDTTCNQNIIANHTVRLSQLEVLADETQNKLLDYGTILTKQTDHKSAFTTTGYTHEDGSYGNIVLGGVVSNIGGHYSPVTGQFTCQYPGVYVFSLNLYKDSDEVSTHCDIRHNGVGQVFVYASYTDGFHEGSSSVVLHLNVADTVDIGDCSPLVTIDSWTNFYGFLLYPD